MPFEFFKKTVHYKKKISAWQQKYDVTAPRAGDLAPDFELLDVTGRISVRLSDFRAQKPVVLIFGSFT